jgi:hypothetical protein
MLILVIREVSPLIRNSTPFSKFIRKLFVEIWGTWFGLHVLLGGGAAQNNLWRRACHLQGEVRDRLLERLQMQVHGDRNNNIAS